MIVTVGELFYESVLSTKILVPGGNKNTPSGWGPLTARYRFHAPDWLIFLESLEGLEDVDTV